MKKIFHTLTGMVLFAVILTFWVPAEANAATSVPIHTPVSLTISAEYAGEVLPDMEYTLYRVADFQEDGSLVVSGSFGKYPVQLRNWSRDPKVATTLAGYIQRDSLSPDICGKTDASGKLTLSADRDDLTSGLYLLLAEPVSRNGYTYEMAPTLVTLPTYDTSSRSYLANVKTVSKGSRTPDRDSGDTTDTTVSYRVVKVWKEDGEEERPEQVTVQLLRNGKVYDTVQLNEKSNWRYTWSSLPRYTNGTTNVWTVVEQEVPGYAVQVSSSGKEFLITNSLSSTTTTTVIPPPDETTPTVKTPMVEETPQTMETPTPEITPKETVPRKTPDAPQRLPQTGLLWWPVPILLLCGTGCLLFGRFSGKRSGLSTLVEPEQKSCGKSGGASGTDGNGNDEKNGE